MTKEHDCTCGQRVSLQRADRTLRTTCPVCGAAISSTAQAIKPLAERPPIESPQDLARNDAPPADSQPNWVSPEARALLFDGLMAAVLTGLGLAVLLGVASGIDRIYELFGGWTILVLIVCLAIAIVLVPAALVFQFRLVVSFVEWLCSIRTGRGVLGLMIMAAGVAVGFMYFSALASGEITWDWSPMRMKELFRKQCACTRAITRRALDSRLKEMKTCRPNLFPKSPRNELIDGHDFHGRL